MAPNSTKPGTFMAKIFSGRVIKRLYCQRDEKCMAAQMGNLLHLQKLLVVDFLGPLLRKALKRALDEHGDEQN